MPPSPARPIPVAPTLRRSAWGDGAALARWLGVDPRGVPDDAAEAWFGALDDDGPALVKVLSARAPLSVQVHPADKPELLVPLEPVAVFAGFRPLDAAAEAPELVAAVPGRFGSVRALLAAWFALPDAAVSAANGAWLARLRGGGAEGELERWALAGAASAADRGTLVLAMLALHRLEPGEALFVPAGVAHTLGPGRVLEVGGRSDGVARAGLSPKPADPAEFLRLVRPEVAPVPVPFRRGAIPVPTARFSVAVRVGGERAPGPSVLVNVGDAAITVETETGALRLAPGAACRAVDATIASDAARVVQVAAGDRLGVLLANAGEVPAGPAVVGVVTGSPAAIGGWRERLDPAAFGAQRAVVSCEDRPVNQALGVVLAWQRVRDLVPPGAGALLAFAFGDGTRAAPLTQAEGGEKPALATFVAHGPAGRRRWLTAAELALRQFTAVEAHLRRSGFDGLVVKWGDEVLVPGVDLSGRDERLRGADVVRFVSRRRVTDLDAASKDWVATDASGRITAFLPRRRRDALVAALGGEVGCVNLGSVAVSRDLLDALGATFAPELADLGADRRDRPDLDPQLFTALVAATADDPDARAAAWRRACAESEAIARIDTRMPDLVPRLRAALERVAERGRPVSIVALDLGEPYWGDLGEQRRIREFFLSLGADTEDGHVARALAGVHAPADAHGNRLVGDCRLGPGVQVRGSVLIDAWVDEGVVVDSVLVGTRAGRLVADRAFDVASVVADLALEPGAGTYRLVHAAPARVRAGERLVTWVSPTGPVTLRGHEALDLRDPRVYDAPVLGNPVSFRDASARR